MSDSRIAKNEELHAHIRNRARSAITEDFDGNNLSFLSYSVLFTYHCPTFEGVLDLSTYPYECQMFYTHAQCVP